MSTHKSQSMAPYGETGSGIYAANAKGCGEVIVNAIPMVIKALESVRFKKGDHPFVICDYGAADGGTSMPLIREIIKFLKLKYGEGQPVQIIYEDQPINDFKSLFLVTQGSDSYLNDFKQIYITASGTNFYEQCLPSESVNLGLSFTAMHWLSKRPCHLSDTIFAVLSEVSEEKQQFIEQAAQDWETLLLHRAKELAAGGQMILVNMCVDGNGFFVGNTSGGKTSVPVILTQLWKSMVTNEEFQNTTVNVHIRTEVEVRAPFEDKESAISKAGLRLMHTKIMEIKCPCYKEWESSERTKDDARVYAQKLANIHRTWLSSSLIDGLSDEKTSQQKAETVEEFYQKYEDLVVENPEGHNFNMMEVYQHIKKL